MKYKKTINEQDKVKQILKLINRFKVKFEEIHKFPTMDIILPVNIVILLNKYKSEFNLFEKDNETVIFGMYIHLVFTENMDLLDELYLLR